MIQKVSVTAGTLLKTTSLFWSMIVIPGVNCAADSRAPASGLMVMPSHHTGHTICGTFTTRLALGIHHLGSGGVSVRFGRLSEGSSDLYDLGGSKICTPK